MKQRVLVLGGSGFMGRALTRHLAAVGFFVEAPTRSKANLDDVDSLKRAIDLAAPQAVVNLAGISSVLHDDRRILFETNAFGHLRVLEAVAATAPDIRVLLASTANVYGQARTFRESDCPAPINEYALSKLMAEQFNSLFSDRLAVCAARPFNCIGRGQQPSLVIAKIVDAFRRRAPRLELGDLSVQRDYVDVRDVCGMWEALLEAPAPPPIVNFGTGKATALRDVIAIVESISGHKMDVVSAPGLLRQRDISFQCADTSVLASLGFKSRYQLTGTLAWMMSEPGDE